VCCSRSAVLDALVARFAAAPVSNPDGSTGISLHVDGGPNTIMNPATGEPWGPSPAPASRMTRPSASSPLAANTTGQNSTPSGRCSSNLLDARSSTSAIYADVLAAINAGGISRGIMAADFIVAAGHPNWNGGLTATQEASLFMHELGHNLGLRHGGGDDFNNKPNYFSSLNYLWSLVGVPPDNRADYSAVVEPAIDEAITGDVNGDGRLTTLNGFHD
jgi:hypothetical protein